MTSLKKDLMKDTVKQAEEVVVKKIKALKKELGKGGKDDGTGSPTKGRKSGGAMAKKRGSTG